MTFQMIFRYPDASGEVENFLAVGAGIKPLFYKISYLVVSLRREQQWQ